MDLKNLNFAPFREPRGFMRVLQWIFAICAFATTCQFSTRVGYTVECKGGVKNESRSIQVTQVVEYPFRVDEQSQEVLSCDNTNKVNVGFYSDVHTDAEFFVATGVISFLYATALSLVYLYADKAYLDNNKYPIADFLGTLVLAVFWLSSSAAWAKGLSDLMIGTDANNFIRTEKICNLPAICSNVITGNFKGLIISILFGFINFILWASNLWFLYKETVWFENILKSSATPNSAMDSS